MKIKKIFLSLLLVMSFLFMSGFTTLAESEIKASAQEESPQYLRVTTYYNYSYVQENEYTYEYYVTYIAPKSLPETIAPSDYFIFEKINVKFSKGINRNTNSYEFYSKSAGSTYTWFTLRVTVLKELVDFEYYGNMTKLFRDDIIVYVNGTNAVNEEYERGYNEGYNAGYEDGYKDFNVADYFGQRNIAKAPDIDYGTASDPFTPSTSIVIINKGYGAPNILLDKPYLFIFIKKYIYDDIIVLFDDYSEVNQSNATRHDMGDYDIYVFNFTNKINSKYRLEIRKENITTSEQLNKFLNDVKEYLYFSHASKLLDSDMAVGFYEKGYITGLEQSLSNHEAYEAGYEKGYDDGYYDGKDDGYYLGYEDGFNDGKTAEYDKGYKDGYRQGSNDTFLKDISKWFGPMVLIVLIAGAYVTARNRRSGD